MFNQYAAGNKVYRGGSDTATMGQVDPAGYVDRELNNRRSQLAQSALQRMGGSQQKQNSGVTGFQVNPNHVSILAIKLLNKKGSR